MITSSGLGNVNRTEDYLGGNDTVKANKPLVAGLVLLEKCLNMKAMLVTLMKVFQRNSVQSKLNRSQRRSTLSCSVVDEEKPRPEQHAGNFTRETI